MKENIFQKLFFFLNHYSNNKKNCLFFFLKKVPILIVGIKKIEFQGTNCYLHFIDLAGINEGEIKGGLLNYKNLIQYDLLDTNIVLVLHNVILQFACNF